MARNKISAGILLYRKTNGALEFFLVHPGGPHNARKDEGVWSIPKGEVETVRNAQSAVRSAKVADATSAAATVEPVHLLEAAKREFHEETSFRIEDCAQGEFIALSPMKLKSGKTVYAFAIEGNIDAEKIVSNTCAFEWPPRSGKTIEIPEVDRGGWFTEEEAKRKLNAGQVGLVEEVIERLNAQ
jgi:predicted NUDIX family NTP pyrophosphohydrolase